MFADLPIPRVKDPPPMPIPALNPLLEAALGYAARGWPVFPCNPENKQPLLRADKDKDGKPIKGTGGVSKATTAPEQIKTWWKRWPQAMIGLAMGHNGLFALDFDPRIDEATGEVFTLERLKAETETQIGCALPASLAARTPSDGVHVYFRQPEGEPIRNRGNLPPHVDVRGLGGYVIAPPSVMSDARRYRWLHGSGPDALEVAEAPAALIAVLREKGGKKAEGPPSTASSGSPPPESRGRKGAAPDVADAVRKYALAALDGEIRTLRGAGDGHRNDQLNTSALKLASLVAAGVLDETIVRASLESAARGIGLDERELQATIDSGWTAGTNNPRDLSEIATAARERASRSTGPPRSRSAASSRPRTPLSDTNGGPSSRGGGQGAKPPGKGHGAGDSGDLTRECAFRPQTDLGNLERFLARYGDDFLYVEAWGWLAWDGKRWNRELAVPLLGHAVQRTMRAIQDEAALIRDSGVVKPDIDWETKPTAEQAAQEKLWHQTGKKEDALDIVVEVKSSVGPVRLSDKIARWGRTSEGAGHINCIARLAEARLAARTEDFDQDPLMLNVQNGTMVFLRPADGHAAAVSIREHRREDRITRIARVTHDPAARCPQFDAFLEKVQPTADMREFLDVWAGYNALGDPDAQKMALFYGEGSNGKGVWITTIAHILGDYAWKAAIETFIDQGKYRKGSDASPDLAALVGRRMVYANEPEDNSKFSDGLIKAMTSDEPLGGVRELNRPPFQLLVTFTNTVLANNKPKIGTDHGIQRRMQLIPWLVIIPDEEADLRLKAKLQGEMSGIFNRMVAGALTYLAKGLVLPEAVREATKEYHEENDLLGQFMDLCIAKAPAETVGAMQLHETFAAWQTWSGNLPATGKPWSMKYLNGQMRKKGFVISKSSTMRWHDIRLKRTADEFVDQDGKPRPEGLHPLPDDPPDAAPSDDMAARGPPSPRDDDDYVPGFDD